MPFDRMMPGAAFPQHNQVMPNPIPVQTQLPPLPAPGQMPMTPNPRLGVANAIANQFGGNPNMQAFQTALGDWRTGMQDWRAARPDFAQGMDKGEYGSSMQDWRSQRPVFPSFRNFNG